MIWVGVFYWVVCGFVAAGHNAKRNEPLLVTLFCFMLGGFIVPALVLRKVIA